VKEAGGEIAFVIVLVDRQEGGREAIEQGGYAVIPIFNRKDLIGTNAGQRSHIAVA
jgi:orotate phosphoribosyltransferase